MKFLFVLATLLVTANAVDLLGLAVDNPIIQGLAKLLDTPLDKLTDAIHHLNITHLGRRSDDYLGKVVDNPVVQELAKLLDTPLEKLTDAIHHLDLSNIFGRRSDDYLGKLVDNPIVQKLAKMLDVPLTYITDNIHNLDLSKIEDLLDFQELGKALGTRPESLDMSSVDLAKWILVGQMFTIQAVVDDAYSKFTALLPVHCKSDSECAVGSCCARIAKNDAKRDLQDYIDLTKLKDLAKSKSAQMAAYAKALLTKGKAAADALLTKVYEHGLCTKMQPQGERCFTNLTCGCAEGLQCTAVDHGRFLNKILGVSAIGQCQ